MIRLFEERVDFIESFINDNEITFNVLSNKDETIKIDWNKCSYSKVVINFSGNGLISLLEIGEPNKISVVYNLNDYSRVNHSIASFYCCESKVDYQVNLNEGSEYRGALADFS